MNIGDLLANHSRQHLMTQYISSFLIDPVVRQARRFSRPASDSPHPEIRPSLQGTETASLDDERRENGLDSHEAFPPLSLDAYGLSAIADTGDQEIPSQIALQGSRNNLPQARDNEENADTLPLVEPSDSGSEVNAQRVNIAALDDTSTNPLHGNRDGPRSITSSFRNSARSTINATMSSVDRLTSNSDGRDTRDRGDSGGSASGDVLPADDGMGDMRKRIIAIQRTDSSNEVKAKLVHGLMTERHNASQQSLLAPQAQSPGSTYSSERPLTPSSPKSVDSLRPLLSPPTSVSSTDPANPFQVSSEDLKPTYYQKTTPHKRYGQQDDSSIDVEDDSRALGCKHYKRNIKLQCSTCRRWYTCRFCHDAVEDHILIRRETKNMLCMLCGCAQPASEECTLCSQRSAWYYCDVCKLWDDSPDKSIYHCDDCGICRIGEGLGKDYFHCTVRNVLKVFDLC